MLPATSELGVRRDKAALSSGCKPHPATAGAVMEVTKWLEPSVWIAGWRETKTLKPIDNVSLGETTSHRAVTTVNAESGPESA